MSSQNSKNWLLLILLPVGFAGVWQLQKHIDGQRTALHQERDELVLRSGKLLKAMSLEYAPLMADIYWTRVVQYYGDKRARHDPNFELLWPLAGCHDDARSQLAGGLPLRLDLFE